jgi:hypothetical protein
MGNQTLWVGFAQNTIGISNSATGNPSPTYLVVEAGAGTVTFTPRSPITAVTGVDVKDTSNGTSKGWTTAVVSPNGMSISDPGGSTGTFYYAVSVTGNNFNGTATLDPLWQQD